MRYEFQPVFRHFQGWMITPFDDHKLGNETYDRGTAIPWKLPPPAPILGVLAYLIGWVLICSISAAPVGETTSTHPLDYEAPSSLVGMVFDIKGSTRKPLFTFSRSSSRIGTSVRVVREFKSLDGKLAAQERVLYDSGQLVSYELEEPQSGNHGLVLVQQASDKNRLRLLKFEYVSSGGRSNQRKVTNTETMGQDVLINDMIPAFMSSRWDSLMKGSTEKFRLIVPSRLETVGFQLQKASEGTENGHQVVWIKMQPSNFVTAQLMDPIIFTIEKDFPHHILQYSGRTTPRIKSGSKWIDLDALTVFEWK